MTLKHLLAATAAILGLSGSVFAASDENANSALGIYRKNMARQHLGTNLFVFDKDNLSYSPTEAAAAWLDDDVSTGWPARSGRTFYLLALPEADLMTNFMISAKDPEGTISLYAGDELAAPDARTWSPIATDVDIASINERKFDKPFSRFAKYLLIETNLTKSGPWYSLYAYGERSAVSYELEKRDSAIDLNSIFGPYTNDQTALSFSSLYTGGRVTEGTADSGEVLWQRAIDDDPQTSLPVAPSSPSRPSLVVRFGETLTIQRAAILAAGSPKGRLDLYLIKNVQSATPVASSDVSNYVRVANRGTETSEARETPDLSGLTPTATIILDGTTVRRSIDFPATQSGYLLVAWTPSDGQSELALSEVNSFSSASLSTYKLNSEDAAVVGEVAERSDPSKDGKTFTDFKDGKVLLPPPVGEILPVKNPFVPGGLGFPPTLTNLGGPQVEETPTSP